MAAGDFTNDRKPKVMVEWIYVQTRTLLILGVLLAVGAGAFYYLKIQHRGARDLRSQALEAIAEADRQIEAARGKDPATPLLISAGGLIETAKHDLAAKEYGHALEEAQEATKIALQILQAAGAEADDTSVKVARASGDVQVKRAGAFSWEPLENDGALRTGDQIRTGSDGTAQLVYFDQSRVTVSPSSLLEIRELYRDSARREQRVSERLVAGSLNASTGDPVGIASIHEVSTEVASVRTRKSAEFQVSHDQEHGKSEVVNYQGPISVETGGREISIPESTRVALADGKIVERTQVLDSPRLVAPPDGKSFLAPRESAVQLAWGTMEKAVLYHAQVSMSETFGATVADLDKLGAGKADLPPLSPENYYWRVAAIDQSGQQGKWSEVRKFRVVGSDFNDLDDRTPPTLEITETLVVGTNAIVSGHVEPGALLWIEGERVDVNDAGKFTWVVKLREDGDNKIQVLAQDAAGNETKKFTIAHVDVF